MSRRRQLGHAPSKHRAHAAEDFAWTRESAKQATEYAGKGACVAATTALVRAAYNYGRGSAHYDAYGGPPRQFEQERRRAKRALDEATEASHHCRTAPGFAGRGRR